MADRSLRADVLTDLAWSYERLNAYCLFDTAEDARRTLQIRERLRIAGASMDPLHEGGAVWATCVPAGPQPE